MFLITILRSNWHTSSSTSLSSSPSIHASHRMIKGINSHNHCNYKLSVLASSLTKQTIVLLYLVLLDHPHLYSYPKQLWFVQPRFCPLFYPNQPLWTIFSVLERHPHLPLHDPHLLLHDPHHDPQQQDDGWHLFHPHHPLYRSLVC